MSLERERARIQHIERLKTSRFAPHLLTLHPRPHSPSSPFTFALTLSLALTLALSLLLFERAPQPERGGDLAAAAAVYDEIVVHYTIGKGAEHEWTREAKAHTARVRVALA